MGVKFPTDEALAVVNFVPGFGNAPYVLATENVWLVEAAIDSDVVIVG